MTDTYTPTMNDVKIWLCEPEYAGGLFDDETAAKFDAALAAHDAEIAAKALTDAADAVVTEEMIAEALHGDACPDDPDEGDTCSCDGADFRRQASIVAALFRGGAK